MNDNSPISPAHAAFYRRRLSGFLFDINALVGLETTRKIALRYGGTFLYVPAKYRSDWDLVGLVGEEAARKLWDHLFADFARSKVEIAFGPFGARYKVQLRAMELFAEGYSAGLVSAETGLARSTVQELRRLYRQENGTITVVHKRPQCEGYVRRRNEGLAALAAGVPLEEVALRFGVSIPTVKKWQKKAAAANQNTPSATDDNRPKRRLIKAAGDE